MNELISYVLCIVLCIIGLVIVLYAAYRMPGDFLNEFKRSCYEAIDRRDREFEEKEKLNKELKKWLFK